MDAPDPTAKKLQNNKQLTIENRHERLPAQRFNEQTDVQANKNSKKTAYSKMVVGYLLTSANWHTCQDSGQLPRSRARVCG
jgi:hypothetical protein